MLGFFVGGALLFVAVVLPGVSVSLASRVEPWDV